MEMNAAHGTGGSPDFELPNGYRFASPFQVLHRTPCFRIGRAVVPIGGCAPAAPPCEIEWPVGFDSEEEAGQACRELNVRDKCARIYEHRISTEGRHA